MVSSPALQDYRCFVGVDIAATSFTALWAVDGRTLPRAVTFAQTPTGFATFQQQLGVTISLMSLANSQQEPCSRTCRCERCKARLARDGAWNLSQPVHHPHQVQRSRREDMLQMGSGHAEIA